MVITLNSRTFPEVPRTIEVFSRQFLKPADINYRETKLSITERFKKNIATVMRDVFKRVLPTIIC